jgi:membrane fusion protein (multidrug efflux system)
METARQPAAISSTPAPKNDIVVEAPAKRKRKPFVILGVIALVALVAISGYTLMTRGRESTDDAQVAADMVPVSARVGGLVLQVHIRENQAVKRGQLLIELDAADLQAKQQQAEAELATAQAQAQAAEAQVQIVDATSKGGLVTARAALTGSAAGVGSADAQLASAKAAAARADADLRKAEIDIKRAQTLRQADAIPQQQLDIAQVALEGARASKAQADAQVALAADSRRGAESRVGEARGRVDQSAPVAPQIASARAGAALAAARVRSAEAALVLSKLQVSYTRIIAPADGYASKLGVHDGQLVSMGQPLIELVPSETYLIASFKETQIGKMHAGQPVTIDVDAFPGRQLKGRVESLAGGTGASFSLLPPDNSTGNFVKVVQRVPVRIALVDAAADVALVPGLSADVTVDVR